MTEVSSRRKQSPRRCMDHVAEPEVEALLVHPAVGESAVVELPTRSGIRS